MKLALKDWHETHEFFGASGGCRAQIEVGFFFKRGATGSKEMCLHNSLVESKKVQNIMKVMWNISYRRVRWTVVHEAGRKGSASAKLRSKWLMTDVGDSALTGKGFLYLTGKWHLMLNKKCSDDKKDASSRLVGRTPCQKREGYVRWKVVPFVEYVTEKGATGLYMLCRCGVPIVYTQFSIRIIALRENCIEFIGSINNCLCDYTILIIWHTLPNIIQYYSEPSFIIILHST